ncbi:MAG: HAD-IB family hydrolase, partial [Deltaproteobacteria bacterium]|nr:HAD-IB family hydrolase [Deltaproteobacteria bacterium]
FYKVYKNFPLNLKDDFSKRCFEEYIYPHLFQEMLDRIAWHRSQNHHIILVSGSLKFILKPLADFIQANALLCPDIQAEENRLNGILTQSPVIGSEKAKLFLEYHQAHHFELNESYSYADSTSDIPILELVGNAFVINPNKKLKKISSLRGWQSLEVSQHPQSHPFYSGASHEF